jgi:hypothetical protein
MASSCGKLFHGLPRCQDLQRRCFWVVRCENARGIFSLLDQVDRGEEADPDDIDEVPVVGHDDGGGRLLVREPLGRVGTAEDQPAPNSRH